MQPQASLVRGAPRRDIQGASPAGGLRPGPLAALARRPNANVCLKRDLMPELKVSQPELIGILCGFAAAAVLTGAIMMFNVWPALTTPPLVIDTPAHAGASPLKSAGAAAHYASTPKTTTTTLPMPESMPASTPSSLPAPATAQVSLPLGAAAPAPPIQSLIISEPSRTPAAALPVTSVVPTALPPTAAAQAAPPSAPAAQVSPPQATGTDEARPPVLPVERPARSQTPKPQPLAQRASAEEPRPAQPPQTVNASAPQPDLKAQIAASPAPTEAPLSATPQSAPAQAQQQILLPDAQGAANATAAAASTPQTLTQDAAPAPSSEAPSASTAAPTQPTAPPAQGVTQSLGGAKTITITYAASSKNAAATARVLSQALRAKGYASVALTALDQPVENNEVKFFNAGDEDGAAKVKAIAAGLKDSHGRHRGFDVTNGGADAANASPGHIEIWLKGS